MELQSTNNATSSFPQPSELMGQLLKMAETMPHLLDDFKKQYISFHKNSQNNENQQLYQSLQSNVENENAKLFVLNNKIEKGMEELNLKLLEFNKNIQSGKKENEKMKKYLARIKNEYNGSDEMISNYKEIYRMSYFKNVSLLFGIILGTIIVVKVFPVLPPSTPSS